MAELEGQMRNGSGDGSIRVWSGATLEHERTLCDEEYAEDSVRSLAARSGALSQDMVVSFRVASAMTPLSRPTSVRSTCAPAMEQPRRKRVYCVSALATWQGKALSGSRHDGVRMCGGYGDGAAPASSSS